MPDATDQPTPSYYNTPLALLEAHTDRFLQIEMSGELTVTTASQFREFARAMIVQHPGSVVLILDLRQIRQIDSAGLMAIWDVHQQLMQSARTAGDTAEAKIGLIVGPGSQPERTLFSTGFSSRFSVAHSEEALLQDLFAAEAE